ncbi:hypothetical protein BKA66DRAFT_422378 [Pyrenochaeta sp. MPI-SDFR-AT-0127]|nr:hypothetical protein BKA66DRAFT_422378 [Pyrenochaeta sp. MPI-SDFR-AT-0127]
MTLAAQESTTSSEDRALSLFEGIGEPEPMQWAAPSNFASNHIGQVGPHYNVTIPFTPGSGDVNSYVQNGMLFNDNNNLNYSAHFPSSGCPRSYNGLDCTGLPNVLSFSESYPPAAYQIEPQEHHDVMDFSDSEIKSQLIQLNKDYEYPYYGASHVRVENDADYKSPYSDLTRASTPHDGLLKYPYDHNAGEEGPIDKEQPYAQLIYQALLQAPNHTMILRDIYDWFRMYTDKASASETKGWQNSIRHNLSMNGAFEKVDQPCEDSRKGFMWRLTEEAIREGVKSTTRYRSKQPNKRAHRTAHPQPQRQASGAKGGQASRRATRMRRGNRILDAYRGEPYTARSVPAAFDPMFNSGEAPIPYQSSPYYGPMVDYVYGSQEGNFTSPLGSPGMDLFSPAPGCTFGSVPHGLPLTDTAYFLNQSPTESLFTNSPSPSADEPRTPVSQGGWNDDSSFATAGFCDDLAYHRYAG